MQADLEANAHFASYLAHAAAAYKIRIQDVGVKKRFRRLQGMMLTIACDKLYLSACGATHLRPDTLRWLKASWQASIISSAATQAPPVEVCAYMQLLEACLKSLLDESTGSLLLQHQGKVAGK